QSRSAPPSPSCSLRSVASSLCRSGFPSDLRFARFSVRLVLSVSLPRVLLVCCPVSVRLRLVPLFLASCSSSSRILIVCFCWYSLTVSPPLVLAPSRILLVCFPPPDRRPSSPSAPRYLIVIGPFGPRLCPSSRRPCGSRSCLVISPSSRAVS